MSLSQLLSKLYSEVQKGNARQAIPHLENLTRQFPAEPSVFHLAGLAYQEIGEYELALSSLKASLGINPTQHEVENTLANLYKALGEIANAEKHYLSATKIAPQYAVAWKNLASLLMDENRLDEALDTLKAVEQHFSGDVSLLTMIGNTLRLKEEYEASATYYRKALAVDGNYVNALHNLGLALKMSEKHDEAISHYIAAKKLAPKVAEIDYNCGNAYFEKGDYASAEKCYLSALTKRSDYLEAHETLNQYYWQLGSHEEFGKSYELALKKERQPAAFYASYAKMLIDAKKLDKAMSILQQGLRQQDDAELYKYVANIYARQKDYSRAVSAFDTVLSRKPTLDVLHQQSQLFLMTGMFEKAGKLLEQALKYDKYHQMSWALQATLWRLVDDERYHWLCDYESFVQSYCLPAPPGYQNLNEFLLALREVLLSMHRTQHAPLDQTLTNGSQTPGRLFFKPFSEVELLKSCVQDVVRQYISTLNNDAMHPFLGRKRADFDFSGSWSVKLRPHGYHVNHVHPEGWISSSLYIHLPETMSKVNETAGNINFGRSSLQLSNGDDVELSIRPKLGHLVLFPSYFWHGTSSFSGGDHEYRLTTPFDVVPK